MSSKDHCFCYWCKRSSVGQHEGSRTCMLDVVNQTAYCCRIAACSIPNRLPSVFVSSVIMYSSLTGVDVPRKLHWIPGETVSQTSSIN